MNATDLFRTLGRDYFEDVTGRHVVYADKPWDVLAGAGAFLTLRTFDRSRTVQAPRSECRTLRYDGEE